MSNAADLDHIPGPLSRHAQSDITNSNEKLTTCTSLETLMHDRGGQSASVSPISEGEVCVSHLTHKSNAANALTIRDVEWVRRRETAQSEFHNPFNCGQQAFRPYEDIAIGSVVNCDENFPGEDRSIWNCDFVMMKVECDYMRILHWRLQYQS